MREVIDLELILMADIFISYSRHDRERADALAAAFEEIGLSVWWDTRIGAGESFDNVIEEMIDQARCVVVLWSTNSVKSRWVRAEAGEGLEREILVPVFIEEVRPPLAFRRIHTASMVDWKGSKEDLPFKRLIEDVSRVLGPLNTSSIRFPSPAIDQLPSTYTNSLGIEFLLIQPGTFMMGSDSGSDREKPVHRIEITKPFFFGKYPITQSEWSKVMGNNPSRYKNSGHLPVESVSWSDVMAFIERVNQKEPGYRLPTEAEWEYVCRAGTSSTYYFGDSEWDLDMYAWYGDNSGGQTQIVGQKRPNAWGFYDMLGNVWEWVTDWYGQYESSTIVDPQGPSEGSFRVIRGGTWESKGWELRSAHRGSGDPQHRSELTGFRLVRTIS